MLGVDDIPGYCLGSVGNSGHQTDGSVNNLLLYPLTTHIHPAICAACHEKLD